MLTKSLDRENLELIFRVTPKIMSGTLTYSIGPWYWRMWVLLAFEYVIS